MNKEIKKYDIKAIIDRIYREMPTKPVLTLKPSLVDKTSVFDSKAGGVPYFPKELPYPVGKDGFYKDKPLKLLAQFNFEKLPAVPDFPEKGILQFFCSCDEEEMVYGLDFDKPTVQNGFRVIYHENIITDPALLISEDDLPEFSDDSGAFPVCGEFLFKAEKVTDDSPSVQDIGFYDRLLKYCGEAAGKKFDMLYQIEEAGFGELSFLYDEGELYERSCIGGYPSFTQDDPRYRDELKKYDTLLFQLFSYSEDGSESEIMWGDMGVANFFIPEEKLKRRDFSDILYNWDCC